MLVRGLVTPASLSNAGLGCPGVDRTQAASSESRWQFKRLRLARGLHGARLDI
jgi:hypothetical protein